MCYINDELHIYSGKRIEKDNRWIDYNMKTKSHYELAEYLLRQYPAPLSGMSGFALKFGSILPDLCFYTHIQSHRYKGSFERIEKKLNRLAQRGRMSRLDIIRLGVQLHYLADYFTYPHNECFEGSMKEHHRYEELLCKGMKDIFESVDMYYTSSAPDPKGAEELMRVIRTAHESYSLEEKMLETDCEYIINVCAVYFRTMYEMMAALEARPVFRLRAAE